MAKYMHWSKTPKGIAHMKKMRKLAVQAAHARKKLAIRHAKTKQGIMPNEEDFDEGPQDALNAAFVLGKVESIIEQYCAGVGVPKAPLARRVAELLLNAQGG